MSHHSSENWLQNWCWNWRLTVLKTNKMVLISPTMTNFKMTIIADFAISAWSPFPLLADSWNSSLKLFLLDQHCGNWPSNMNPLSLSVAGLWNKATFPSTNSCLLSIGFQAASSHTWVSSNVCTLLAQLPAPWGLDRILQLAKLGFIWLYTQNYFKILRKKIHKEKGNTTNEWNLLFTLSLYL